MIIIPVEAPIEYIPWEIPVLSFDGNVSHVRRLNVVISCAVSTLRRHPSTHWVLGLFCGANGARAVTRIRDEKFSHRPRMMVYANER